MIILFADDHDMLRDALTPFLLQVAEGVTVIHADTWMSAIEKASEEPDLKLIIVDLTMPGRDGLAGLREMLLLCPDVPIAVLSATFDESTVLTAMGSGAAAYIPKTLKGHVLIHILRLVVAGERYLPPSLFLHEPAVKGQHRHIDIGLLELLSSDELLTASLLRRGLSNKEISLNLDVKGATIKKRLSAIYHKLGVTNRTQAALKIAQFETDSP